MEGSDVSNSGYTLHRQSRQLHKRCSATQRVVLPSSLSPFVVPRPPPRLKTLILLIIQ